MTPQMRELIIMMARNQLVIMRQIRERCAFGGEYYSDYSEKIESLGKLVIEVDEQSKETSEPMGAKIDEEVWKKIVGILGAHFPETLSVTPMRVRVAVGMVAETLLDKIKELEDRIKQLEKTRDR